MKSSLIFLSLLASISSCSQPSGGDLQAAATTAKTQEKGEQAAIEKVVKQFIAAANMSDTIQLSAILHDQYRIVLNRLMGDQVSVIDKQTYLQLISNKTLGGVPRTLKIVSVAQSGTVASVQLETDSEQAQMTSFLHLIREPEGRWLLVGDTPFAVFKK